MLNRKILSGFISILLLIFTTGCDDLLMIDATDTAAEGLTLEKKLRGIWVIGGVSDTSGNNVISQIDMYDPVTGTWYSDVASTADGSYIPTSFNMTVSVSGKIYVIGGATNSTTVVGNVFAYDISSNTWTLKTAMPAVRMDSVAGVLQNKIYILGGSNTVSGATGQTTIYIYDIETNLWSTSATVLPAGRTGMAYYNNYGALSYSGGRLVTTAAAQSLNDIYQIIQNAFSGGIEQGLTSARYNMASSGYSGNNGTFMFMVGGATATISSYFSFLPTYVAQANSFIVYTPPATTASGIFLGPVHPSFGALTSTGIVFSAAAVSNYNGSTGSNPTLYVMGGLKNQSTVTADVHSITANGLASGAVYGSTASWSTKTSMPRARFGHRAVIINQ